MLSLDITDRNIRIVKGSESNNKIKISSAATLDLEEGLIVNGHVKDVPNVATAINGMLKRNKMPDKEAIVSISSNLTIFKELNVARAKNQDFAKTVRQQMQAELNLDDTYCVTYVIVGDNEEKGPSGETITRVLATACPFEIVNSYREVFKLLGISLKSVMVGCNCITRVLLADTKIKAKMPLLAVQIDNNFISLNLYEEGQLSFSRFASIDADDYGGSSDYVFEAVNENIFRMLQFHRSRSTNEVIENVLFYGDTHDFVRLTDELEKLDLQTSLINVPPQIHGHENLEFSLYANAIGALFKREKDKERLNLLETDLGINIRSTKTRNDNAGYGVMLATVAAAAVVVVGAWAVQSARDAKINKEIEEIEDYLNSPDTKKQLDHQAKLLVMKDKVDAYYTSINNAHDAFYSKPVINGEKFDAIETVLENTAGDLGVDYSIVSDAEFADGIITFDIVCDATDDMAQKLPGDLVENLLDPGVAENGGYFINAAYEGYDVEIITTETQVGGAAEGEGEEGGASRTVSSEDAFVGFEVKIALKGRESAYHPVEESADDSSAEEAAE